MPASRRSVHLLVALLTLGGAVAAAPGALAGTAGRPAGVTVPTTDATSPARRVPTLSTSDRLPRRRFVVAGTRAYEVGTEDARYPVIGFHTRGEMGGFWSPPVKLLDGLWFGVDGRWVGPATRFTRGYGTVSFALPATSGVSLARTDVVPDGTRAVLVRLRLSAPTTRTVRLMLDAHSELMSVYPWGETTPSQLTVNGQDAASGAGGRLTFTDARHPYAAVVGAASLTPTSVSTGRDDRGPQEPAQVCPASGPKAPKAPDSCDDTAYGRGAGGQLTYSLRLAAHTARSVWFVVAGSDTSLAAARATYAAAVRAPAAAAAAKVAGRVALAARSRVSLPGDPLLTQSLLWSRQDLADLHQSAANLHVRETNSGTRYPAPVGPVPFVDFEGAGYPDYPWLFATDGEYTAYALLATGQFRTAEDHLRALRDVSNLVNHRSGKIVHETTTDGSVYFGANADAGNTDESVKFPSAVALVWRWTGDDAFRDEMYDSARRALAYVTSHLDADKDGWPEGAGNVERTGQGQEKVDNTVYLIRGWYDLAAMAASRGETAAAAADRATGAALLARFDAAWWVGTAAKDGAPAYADSLADPGNVKVFQRYWTGLTPLEAELPGRSGQPGLAGGSGLAGIAPVAHADATLALHETPCYTGAYGLFHTGSGPGSLTPKPACGADRAVSTASDERDTFTLNSAIAGVAEGNYGRMDKAQFYADREASLQFPSATSDQAEMPGAMPERAGGDTSSTAYYGSNLGHLLTERGMVMQAWGAYGTWWPVVHQVFGVSPDLGVRQLAVLPELPTTEQHVTLANLRLGAGSLGESVRHEGRRWTTQVATSGLRGVTLTLGVVLPAGTAVAQVRLDGHAVAVHTVLTHRGLQVAVTLAAAGRHTLVVTTG